MDSKSKEPSTEELSQRLKVIHRDDLETMRDAMKSQKPEFPYKFKKEMMGEVAQIMQQGMASCRTLNGLLDSLAPLATKNEVSIMTEVSLSLEVVERFFADLYSKAARIGYTDDNR